MSETWVKKIVRVRPRDVLQKSGRPSILSSTGRDGIVMVYADWCPYCRMFKPWLNEYAENAPSHSFLGVIDSTDSNDIFEGGEVAGFPSFKRVINGVIERPEVSIDRSSRDSAFFSLNELLRGSPQLDALDDRLHEVELLDESQELRDEVARLRAELAKTTAVEKAYHEHLMRLQEEISACEAICKSAPKLKPVQTSKKAAAMPLKTSKKKAGSKKKKPRRASSRG